MKFNKKKIATVVCAVLVGFTIVGKLLKSDQVVNQMEKLELQDELYFLALIETIALVIYLIPKTLNLGFFILTAYYGGAIAVNLNSPIDMIPGTVFLLMIWSLTYIRKPQLFR